MSDEDKSGSQILNLSPFKHDPIQEKFNKSSSPKSINPSELNSPKTTIHKLEEHIKQVKPEKVEEIESKMVGLDKQYIKKQGPVSPKTPEDSFLHSSKTYEILRKQSPVFTEKNLASSNNDRKPNFTNIRPGDAHLDDVGKRIAHKLASQQLSQITSGGFDPQNLSKNFWALIQTNNKSPQNVPNHLHVISPSHRNCENQLKEKNFEEIQNFQNQNKLPVETNENLPANSMCLSHLNLNSRLPNNEMSKSLDGSVGLEKENKDDDSCRNSEDNFSPDTYRAKHLNKRKIKNCGNKFCKTDLSCWNSKFTRVKSENNSYMMLCTNCAKAHRKGQYCYYCKQIYLDNDDDGKDWIQCDFCKKWVHVDCEQFHGDQKFKSIMTAKDFIYFCPKCKKMKSKASGPKRKSYDNIEFAACKQPKKNKKRFDPSQYNLYNSSHENNETNNKSPKINEEIQAYDAVMITGNGSLAELKKVFYELPYVKPSGNNKKTNAPNENSYNSIDHLMIAYGIKLSLSDNEITRDLNNLKGITEKNEGIQDENKTSPTKMELEEENEILEKANNEKNDVQNKSEVMEEEENEEIDENEEKKSKSEEEENEIDKNNNSNLGNKYNRNLLHGNKRKSNNNSKNYSLRKIINIKQTVLKNESDDSKSKEKIDSKRVLRNRKK